MSGDGLVALQRIFQSLRMQNSIGAQGNSASDKNGSNLEHDLRQQALMTGSTELLAETGREKCSTFSHSRPASKLMKPGELSTIRERRARRKFLSPNGTYGFQNPIVWSKSRRNSQ
jgi:hypothetical protein